MLDPNHPLAKLLADDRRYKLDAYVFVEEALSYAHDALGMGAERPPAESGGSSPRGRRAAEPIERHLTGQELCEAIRQYALEQYGYMAKSVLNTWGVRCTGDFGNIVFNLIEIGRMKKTDEDQREDFDDVYDFDLALREQFKIAPTEDRSNG